MSALIFHTDENQVLVVTDTLATKSDGTPFLFTSKAHYLPHLRTIVAGTGVGGFSVEWCMRANSNMAVCGIENLNYHTPSALCSLWAEYKDKESFVAGMTTTVYQFGISEESGNVVAYAYRSTSDFISESIKYGTGVKPECSVPEGNVIEHMQTMMQEQRDIQSKMPLHERIFIGGEAMAIHLTKSGCSIRRLFEFPDFGVQLSQAFQTFGKPT